MAKYTTEVRSICEFYAGLTENADYNDVTAIVTTAAPKIFSFDFPIYDENYRLVLETKILKHYYTREIGLETPGLWKLKLDARMNEIMPYYNQLYRSALIEFNPLYDFDLHREHTRNENTDSTGKSEGMNRATGSVSNTSQNISAYSETPQGGLTDLINNNYLTNAQKNNETSETLTGDTVRTNSEITGKITSVEGYIEHVYGSNGLGGYSKKILDFRKTFLNIDMMIINDLKDLFFLLW